MTITQARVTQSAAWSFANTTSRASPYPDGHVGGRLAADAVREPTWLTFSVPSTGRSCRVHGQRHRPGTHAPHRPGSRPNRHS